MKIYRKEDCFQNGFGLYLRRHRFECDRQPLNWPRYCFEALGHPNPVLFAVPIIGK